jgi:hypothetical protein
MSWAVKKFLTLGLILIALATRAQAQVTAGEASMNLNGTISAGYGNDTSNIAGSDHSIFGAGVADLSGSYYNPNFLTFNIQPFYNQSRFNSTYQSLTAASGVSASAGIFAGSHFPGSVSYSASSNSTGTFGIPNLANYTTNGNVETLAVNWGVRFENYPTLNLIFSDTDANYSLYGADNNARLHSEGFSATSAYKVAGFNLNGGYQYSGSNSFLPEFLSEGPPENTNTGSNMFFLGIGHALPWHGNFSASGSHMKLDEDFTNTASTYNYNTSIDTLTSGMSFAPVDHLNVGVDGYYTDNLLGTLQNTLLASGVTAPATQPQLGSHDLTLTGNANYVMPAEHLFFHGMVERMQQTLVGYTIASDVYNGEMGYANRFWGGQFNGTLGLTRSSVSTTGETLLGLNTSINYVHSIRKWTVGGGFAYSQDTQTVLVGYTTSGYSYNGSVSRRIGRRSYWGAYASGARSLLTGEPGTANASQSYSTSLSVRRFSVNGSYSNSSGNSLLTPTGLVTTPIPLPVVNPAAVVLFNGKSYSGGLGAQPIRGLTLTANYTKALSTTNSNSIQSSNNDQILFCLMTYAVRKLTFTAGYSQLIQGFSVTGLPATRENSFYVGISRWFNFF